MDRTAADHDLDELIAAAIARAHARAAALPPPEPHGLAAFLRRLFGRPAASARAHRAPIEPRAYLAVWCEDVEPLGDPAGEHPHALAHGHLPAGEPVRWVAEAGQAAEVAESLGRGHEPVAVSIGSWQRV